MRNIVSLVIMALFLLSLVGNFVAWSTISTMKLATAASHLAHKKKIAKTKARARVSRKLVAIPVAGIGIAAWLEKNDYDDWRNENPNASKLDYISETKNELQLLATEIKRDLGETINPDVVN